MKKDSFSSQSPLSTDDVIKSITSAVPGADQARAKGLNQLGMMRNAQAQSLSREQILLARKHGTDQHPRIAIARQRFAHNEQFRREIAVMNDLADTPLPEPKDDTMIVHGFVRRRSDHTGIPCLTLALTDDQGNWIKRFGYACTDQRGYFSLEFPAPASAKAATNAVAGNADAKTNADLTEAEKKRLADLAARKAAEKERAAAAGAKETDTTTRDMSGSDKLTLTLRVFDSQGRVLHTESRPVEVKGGAIDYRYILLGDDKSDCGCTPPPEQAGGRPATTGPKPSTDKPAQPAVPAGTAKAPTESKLTNLKSYTQPDRETLARHGQPLEAIRGIGPKSADKLRGAGIKDVAGFTETKGATLVKVAGFDKTPPKARAEESPHVSAAEKVEAARKAAAKKKKK